jgi:hypothetical protein
MSEITDQRVRDIAHAVVTELLLTMGADTSEPKSMQQLQQDFAFIRSWRRSTETIKTKGLSAAVFFIVTAGLGYVAYLFKGHLP